MRHKACALIGVMKLGFSPEDVARRIETEGKVEEWHDGKVVSLELTTHLWDFILAANKDWLGRREEDLLAEDARREQLKELQERYKGVMGVEFPSLEARIDADAEMDEESILEHIGAWSRLAEWKLRKHGLKLDWDRHGATVWKPVLDKKEFDKMTLRERKNAGFPIDFTVNSKNGVQFLIHARMTPLEQKEGVILRYTRTPPLKYSNRPDTLEITILREHYSWQGFSRGYVDSLSGDVTQVLPPDEADAINECVFAMFDMKGFPETQTEASKQVNGQLDAKP